MQTTPDPYDELADLLVRAGLKAAQCADSDANFPSPWGQAEMALQLASSGLPEGQSPSHVGESADPTDCLELVRQALRTLQDLAPADRRPSYTLDLAYVDAAVRAVERAAGQ